MSAPIQMLCNYCDDPKPTIRLIMLGGKRHAVNMDGSAHKHIKNALTQSQSQSQQETPTTTTTTQPVSNQRPYQQTQAQADRQSAIQQAHEENIEAFKEIAEAIRDLAAAIREKEVEKEKEREKNFG